MISSVDAAADVMTPLEKGEREAEDAMLNTKRQKLEESTVQAETKVTTSAKDGHVDSELGDKGTDLEECITAGKKEPAVTVEIRNIAASKKKDEMSDKSESPSEFETSSDAIRRKAYATLTIEGLVAAIKKTEKSSTSSDSSSQDQTCLDEDIAAPNEAPTTPNAKKLVVSVQKKDESSSFEFGCDDETSSGKYVATTEKAPEVPTNEGPVIATKNKDESSNDVGSACEYNFTATTSSAAVTKEKNVSIEEPELDNPKTLSTQKEQIAAGSKTLYVGNLSFSVEQEDVEDFFKAAGEVVNIRFGMNPDETFRGFGYVEFASAEAAEKALHELHGKELLRRPVKLDKMRSPVERFGSSGEVGAVISNDIESSQMGRREGKRIFVRGFNKFDGEDQIRSSLEEHFGSCGIITRVSIPMGQDGAVKGIALIEFKDNDAFNQALTLDGSNFGGSALTVEEARPRRDTCGSGRGGGRGWRSGGWDFGGRSSWRSGGGDFDGRSSWSSGVGNCDARSSWRSGGEDFGGNSWRSGGWDSGGRSGSRDFSCSKNYFSVEVDAATDLVAPKKLLEKGKREAEDAINDEVFNAKRQKSEESIVQSETKKLLISMQDKDESSSVEFGFNDETSPDKDVAKAEKAPAVPTNEDLVISTKNKDESSSDVGSAGEDDVTAKNSSAAVTKNKNLSNDEPELNIPKTIVTPREHITGSKTLYVGNLSFAVEQEDVEHFFEGAGEVVNIRFAMNSDETFRGFGYVEFATAEAAEKPAEPSHYPVITLALLFRSDESEAVALKELNGKHLLHRPVRLDILKERRSYAPYSGTSNDSQFIKVGRGQGHRISDHGFSKVDEDRMRSLVQRFGPSDEMTRVSIRKDEDGVVKCGTEPSQMGRRDQGQRIFVRGFNKFDGEDQIRSSLEEHFGCCGKITRVSIPVDEDGAIKGIALIDFKDNDAFNQALKLDGSNFGGSVFLVEEARPRRDTGGTGRGSSHGWRSGGWDSGGRSSRRSGSGDFGERSSWRSGVGENFGGRSSWRSGGGENFGGRSSWRSGVGENFGGRSSWRSGGGVDFGGNSWRSVGWDSGERRGLQKFSWHKYFFPDEVNATTDVVSPVKLLEKGKRDVEDAIEDEVLNAKRQKSEESAVQGEPKVTTSARHEDSELGLEEFIRAAKKEPAEIGNIADP